jgi:hypothetical protein
VVLILIDLDLKICLNGLQNKFKCEKKKEKKENLPVPWLEARFALACSPLSLFAWAEPNRAGVLLPFLAVGPSEPSHHFPAFPCVCVDRPRAQLWLCVPLF